MKGVSVIPSLVKYLLTLPATSDLGCVKSCELNDLLIFFLLCLYLFIDKQVADFKYFAKVFFTYCQ